MEHNKSPSFPPNSSPKLQWGSPALHATASFPPMNRTAVPNVNTPPHRPPVPMAMRSWGGMAFEPGAGPGSPQFSRAPYPHSFRTPQPQPRHNSPNAPRSPWSDNRGNKQQRFPKNHSPFGSPSMNPGGSDDITQYYHPAMLSDPWKHVPPQPVNHWLNQ